MADRAALPDVYGPYEYRIVLHEGGSGINGPHQGGWVEDTEGKDWFVHFQDAGAYGRVLHLQPMCWNRDWPFMGTEQNGDGIGEPWRNGSFPLWRTRRKKRQSREPCGREMSWVETTNLLQKGCPLPGSGRRIPGKNGTAPRSGRAGCGCIR